MHVILSCSRANIFSCDVSCANIFSCDVSCANKFSCDISCKYSNICKATTVTHTKRICRGLLHKGTSFVCCTSSVLRRGRRVKQEGGIAHCCWDRASRLQGLKIAKVWHRCGSSTERGCSTVRRARIATAIRKATPNAMSNFVSQKCRMAVAIWVR